jgi:uncharacterized tellurite resistance protein B-like protein
MVFEKPSEELLARLRSHLQEQPDQTIIQKYVTQILVRVAKADDTIDGSERGVISKSLRDLFSLKPAEAESLVEASISDRQSLRDVRTATAYLVEHLSLADRQSLVDYIDNVVLADGSVHEMETFLRHQIADLLGVLGS